METQLFDTLLDGVVIVDSEETIIYVNRTFGSLINTPLKRIKVGNKLSDYLSFTPRVYPKTNGFKNIVNPTPYKEVKLTSKSASGKVQVTIQPYDSNWILFIKDVALEETLQKKYRAELDQKENVIVKLEVAHKTLKEYSNTLELKVKERTADLTESNMILNTMINSLGQGFIIIDKEGLCSPVYSKASVALFETNPASKKIVDVLSIAPENRDSFKRWVDLLFLEPLPFNDLIKLGPQTYTHSKNRHITLEYYAARNNEKKIANVVIVATDKTREINALHAAESERLSVKRIIKLVKNKELVEEYVRNTEERLNEIKKIIATPKHTWDVQHLGRIAHTIKGNSGIFFVTSLVKVMSAFETALEKNEDLGEYVSEALSCLNGFLDESAAVLGHSLNSKEKFVEIPFEDLVTFHGKLNSAPQLAEAFEKGFIKEPIGKFFEHYNDLAQELASKGHKKVKPIQLIGADLRIHAQQYGEFFKAFVHLITNSIEHGIEQSQQREALGKDPRGLISIKFEKQTDKIQITVQDDGAGIDPNKIREKLGPQEKSEALGKSDEEIIQYVFGHGISTKKSVSEFSGRGFGLGALRQTVLDLGGKIKIYSEIGIGTKTIITLPESKALDTAA